MTDALTEEERDFYAALADALGVELVELPVEEVAKLHADIAAGKAAERELVAEVEDARRKAAAAQEQDDQQADEAWPAVAAAFGLDAEPVEVEDETDKLWKQLRHYVA